MPENLQAGAVPAQFRAFFDDAATFPPGSLPLDEAIEAHILRRSNPLCDAVGPAVLPLDALAQAQDLAGAQKLDGRPVQVSVVVPPGQLDQALARSRAVEPELVVAALEIKIDAVQSGRWCSQIAEAGQLQGVDAYVELSAEHIANGALQLLAGHGLKLKFRTGGMSPDQFPGIDELARVIEAAADLDVPFKLTAGLHRAVRYVEGATGITHHGFLNIAVATSAAQLGVPVQGIRDRLSQTDGDQLAAALARQGTDWRRMFTSFGTCSVQEPGQTLNELGMFPAGLH